MKQNVYQKRFETLTNYIYDHRNDRLDLETLAEIACFSPYHLHRLYRCHFGETLANTVKRIRLHHAASELIRSQDEIELIAKRAGYTTVQSFSRAFKEAFAQPPASFRSQSTLPDFCLEQSLYQGEQFEVRIEQKGDMSVVGLPHKGDYMSIGRTFESFFGKVAAANRLPEANQLCGLYWDDPDSGALEELSSVAGALNSQLNDIPEMKHYPLEQSLFVILRFKGPYSLLHHAYQWLYAHWLPQSGYSPRHQPVLEAYLNNPRDVPPSELLTDIYLAIEPNSAKGT